MCCAGGQGIPKEQSFDGDTDIYTSSAYLSNGAAGAKMEEAGFCWHPIRELGVNNLERGDILVRNGHVEVFEKFEGDVEYAWTWGNGYRSEPVKKESQKRTVVQIYSGVWRLEED